ncbi:MAG: cytochrome P450 [Acidimicrobiia bacterium]|nr:cytochrome P450 [Acidimicrobiia bacterium]
MTATQQGRRIDVLDGRLYDDPWETYTWLRERAPVYRDEQNGLWVVSKYADLSHVERHPEIWSSGAGVRPVPVSMSIITLDAPEHTYTRRLVNKGFTPRMVAKMESHVREVTRGILDTIASRGEIDFVEDFAIHVPLIVIAELMGLPPEDRHLFYRWSDDMMAGDNHFDADDPVMQRAQQAFLEYVAYLQGLFEEKRRNPADDLVSILLGVSDEGGLVQQRPDDTSLEADELLMFLVLLIVAGNETTRNAITGGLEAFSRFPEQRERFVAHLGDTAYRDRAIEEVLRFTSPVISFLRTCTQDVEYGGVEMKEGDKVFLLYQSANRDTDIYTDPDSFDIEREPNDHLAFGIGPHYCLGANLARMELRVVFEEMFARFPDMRSKEPGIPFQRGPSSLVMSIQHLPAVFTPESKGSTP